VNLGLFFRAALGYCFNACGGHIHRRSNNGTPTFTVVETATSAMAMTVHALSGKTHSRKNIRDIQVRMSKPDVVKVAGGGDWDRLASRIMRLCFSIRQRFTHLFMDVEIFCNLMFIL
jgi:hypothetical protein